MYRAVIMAITGHKCLLGGKKKSTGLSGAFAFPISLLQYKRSSVRFYLYPDE